MNGARRGSDGGHGGGAVQSFLFDTVQMEEEAAAGPTTRHDVPIIVLRPTLKRPDLMSTFSEDWLTVPVSAPTTCHTA